MCRLDSPDAVAIVDTRYDTVELEIGGQLINKHTGQWMEVWAELTEPNPTGTIAGDDGTGGTLFQRMSGMGGIAYSN